MVRFLQKSWSRGPLPAILFISLTAILIHGLAIPGLGYYHDDWYMLWSGASRGAMSLISLFSMDRPFMGAIYTVFYRLVGDNIAGWHLLALAFRIAGALAFYWIITIAWPRLRSLAVLAAMLFVIYPGFLAEPNAATKINHLLGYGAALFSIAFTLQAARESRRPRRYAWTALALLLMALYLWLYEYMVGLEVMRVALLLWLLWRGERGRLAGAVKRAALVTIPYLAVIGLFLFWRVFIFESTRPATDLRGLVTDYQTNFLQMLLRLVFQTLTDFLSTTIFAWLVQAYQLFSRAAPAGITRAILLALAAALLAAGLAWIARRSEHAKQPAEPETIPPYILLLIGAVSTLGAVFPVVLSNRHLDLLDAYKGYALHPSAGVMILLLGVLLMLQPRFRVAALIALIALSAATQSLNTQRWAAFWELQRGMWWQLTWRAPDIEDETLIMAYLPDGYTLQQDYEIWGPVNLIYRPGLDQHSPPVKAEVLNSGTLQDVFDGRVTDPWVRDIFMPRDYNNLLLISQPAAGACIHVIDGSLPAYSAGERPIVEQAGPFSDLSHILPAGSAPLPPPDVFGPEPARGWCYFYQQAQLARQVGDWARIAELYDSAVSAGLTAGDASEYFVFVEGLANQGRADEAAELANQTIRENAALKYGLCQDLSAALPYPADYGYRQEQIKNLICE